jgi:hypothetical protein
VAAVAARQMSEGRMSASRQASHVIFRTLLMAEAMENGENVQGVMAEMVKTRRVLKTARVEDQLAAHCNFFFSL